MRYVRKVHFHCRVICVECFNWIHYHYKVVWDNYYKWFDLNVLYLVLLATSVTTLPILQ